jgi:hypothetical protein
MIFFKIATRGDPTLAYHGPICLTETILIDNASARIEKLEIHISRSRWSVIHTGGPTTVSSALHRAGEPESKFTALNHGIFRWRPVRAPHYQNRRR